MSFDRMNDKALGSRVSQRPTLKDVASIAGVSPQAVSLVINNKSGVSQETRAHIERVIKQLNYIPHSAAQAMRSASTRTLAYVFSGTKSGRLSASGYLEEILNGALAGANQHGYNLLLYSLQLSGGQIQDLQSRCDGVISVISELGKAQLSDVENLGLPLVEVQRRNKRAYSVCADDAGGVNMAVGYLARRGHSRIAYIGRSLTTHTSQVRYEGYVNGLSDHALTFDGDLLRYADQGAANLGVALSKQHDPQEITQGLELCLDLLKLPSPPTAIICFDDLLAVGALRAAHLRNIKVPEELSVIGFNNFGMASAVTPPLTTIGFPAYELGVVASEMLIQHLKAKAPDQRERTLPVQLFVRESA